MSNIQFHLLIQPKPSWESKSIKSTKPFWKKNLFSCKIVSPTIICQILAAFKMYVVPVFSENIHKLDLSFTV